MNLCFYVKECSAIIHFPFQTTTELTYSVLNVKSNEERMKLIEKYLMDRNCDEKYITETMAKIKALFSCENLEISMI